MSLGWWIGCILAVLMAAFGAYKTYEAANPPEPAPVIESVYPVE